MRVYATRRRFKKDSYPDKAGDVFEVKEIRSNFCCNQMENAWGNFVYFGEWERTCNRSETVNVYRCYAYPEGPVFDEMPIKFCPFCSEKIQIEIEEAA